MPSDLFSKGVPALRGVLSVTATQGMRLRAPPFAKELIAARARDEAINVHAHVGRDAWKRAQLRTENRLVIPLDTEHSPESFDFSSCAELEVTLNARDCDLVLARRVAIRMCQHGARMVVLLHPALPQSSEFFYRGSK
jgi:hypothetical protein